MTKHKLETVIGVLNIVRRVRNSRNGNPRYIVRISGYNVTTKPDSTIGYNVQDLNGKTVMAVVGQYFGKPTLFEAVEYGDYD